MPTEWNDTMEMPCRCDCGNWFDLLDGFSKRDSDIIICEDCYKIQEEEREVEEEVQDIKQEIADAEWTIQDSTSRLNILLKKYPQFK